MKIVPTVKQIMNPKSWQANLPWILVGVGVTAVAVWIMNTYTTFRPLGAIELRSPTRIVPEPAYELYHPSYSITHAPTPTYGCQGCPESPLIYEETPTQAIGISSPTVGRFKVY